MSLLEIDENLGPEIGRHFLLVNRRISLPCSSFKNCLRLVPYYTGTTAYHTALPMQNNVWVGQIKHQRKTSAYNFSNKCSSSKFSSSYFFLRYLPCKSSLPFREVGNGVLCGSVGGTFAVKTSNMSNRALQHRRLHNLLLLQKHRTVREGSSPLTLILDTVEQSAKPLIQRYIHNANASLTSFPLPQAPSHTNVLTFLPDLKNRHYLHFLRNPPPTSRSHTLHQSPA